MILDEERTYVEYIVYNHYGYKYFLRQRLFKQKQIKRAMGSKKPRKFLFRFEKFSKFE
jgi:hypothetical protein